MTAAVKLATYADLLALSDDVRAEVVGGEIATLPAPRPRHSKPQGALRRFLGGPFDDDDGHGGPGGWWIFLEVDVALTAHDIVRPDLSGWRRERLPQPDQRPIPTRPDWACEILSPSNARHDLVTKRRLYAKHGITHYWLVDPEARTLLALELRGEQWVELGFFGDEDSASIAPFEAVELSIGRLFLPIDPSAAPIEE
jgi:Uma2 family endonuclease